MFGQQPWYYQSNPYASYQPAQRGPSEEQIAEQRRRALLEQRARRAQWLPDELFDEDEDDGWGFGNYGRQASPYAELKRRQELAEQQRRQEALRKLQAMEAARRQEEQRRNEVLLRKQKEEEEAKQEMWAQQRQQALKEEEELRLRAEQEKHAQSQRKASPTRGSPGAVPIPIHVRRDSPSPARKSPASSPPRASAEPQPPSPKSPKLQKPVPTLEEQNEAASRIQQQFRIHASIRALDQAASDFEGLKKAFVYPHIIDFQKPGAPGEHITVPAYRPPSDFDKEPEDESEETPMDVDGADCKLDFTSTNYPLNSHLEALDKLLMCLDGVESWGQKKIRMKRRGVVKSIEREQAKLERYWRQAWTDYIEKHPLQQNPSAPADDASPMETDDDEPKTSEASRTATPKVPDELRAVPIHIHHQSESENESSGDDLGQDVDAIDEADFEWF